MSGQRPICWQGYDVDPGGFKKMMLYDIMKQFNCEAVSSSKGGGFYEQKNG